MAKSKAEPRSTAHSSMMMGQIYDIEILRQISPERYEQLERTLKDKEKKFKAREKIKGREFEIGFNVFKSKN